MKLSAERRALLLEGALVLAGALLYLPALGNEFTVDDHHSIVGNRGVTGPFSLELLVGRRFWGHAFSDPQGPFTWRPLTSFSCWLDWHLGGGRPWVFLAHNLLLYAAVLAAGALLLRRLAPSLPAAARALALAVFAALALHVDVVPSASGRGELLSAALSLASLALWLPSGASRGAGLPALAFGLAALASFAKESALPMLLLGPLLAWRHRAPERGASAKQCAAGAGLGLALALGHLVFRARYLALVPRGANNLFDNPLHAWGPLHRQWGAAQALGHYLHHAAWPDALCYEYLYAQLMPHDAAYAAGAAGAVAAFLVLAALAHGWRARAPWSAAALGALASYAVISHVLVPSLQFVADRTFFLPSFWLVLLVALALDAALRSEWPRRVVAAVVALYALGQGARAFDEARRWRSDRTFSESYVRSCPLSVRARIDAAQFASSAEESAWQLLTASYLASRFPAPLRLERTPARWEPLPVEQRLLRLLQATGPARARVLLESARRLAVAQSLPEAAEVLGTWGARIAQSFARSSPPE